MPIENVLYLALVIGAMIAFAVTLGVVERLAPGKRWD